MFPHYFMRAPWLSTMDGLRKPASLLLPEDRQRRKIQVHLEKHLSWQSSFRQHPAAGTDRPIHVISSNVECVHQPLPARESQCHVSSWAQAYEKQRSD